MKAKEQKNFSCEGQLNLTDVINSLPQREPTSFKAVNQGTEEPMSTDAVAMIQAQAQPAQLTKKEKPETKSKRFNCLLYPSLYEKLLIAADITGQSANDIINGLIADFVTLHADQIAQAELDQSAQALADAKATVKAAKKNTKA